MGRASKFKKLAEKIEAEKEAALVSNMTITQRRAHERRKLDPREIADIVIDGKVFKYEDYDRPRYFYPLKWEEIPMEYKNSRHWGQKIASDRFFNGTPIWDLGISMKPGMARGTFNQHVVPSK